MSISEIPLNTEQLQILGIRRDAMNRNIRREEYTHHLGIDEFFSIYNTVSQIALLDTFKPYKLLPPDFDHEATLYRHVKPLFPILK